MSELPKAGEYVKYVDEFGVERDALITSIHGPGETPSVNVVIVSNDPNQTDTYGQKIVRETSQPHKVNQTARGRYWYRP